MKKNSERHIYIVFIILSFIIFFNLNGVFALIFGQSGLLSPVILILSLYGIFALTKILPRELQHGYYLRIFFYFLFIYLLIALLSGLVNFENLVDEISWVALLRSNISIYFIIYFYFLSTVYFIYVGDHFKFIKFFGILFFISVAASGILDYFGVAALYDTKLASKISGPRSGGIFANPNELGAQSTLSLCFMIFLFLKGKNALLYFIGIAVSLYMAFISFSKAAIIVSGLILIFYFINNLFKRHNYLFFNRGRIAFFQISIVFVLIGILFNSVLFSQKIKETLEGEQLRRFDHVVSIVSGKIEEENTSYRLELANKGIELIKERPLFGHGFGSFHRLKDIGLGVHNGYLMILGESGIIPFLFLIMIFLMFIVRSINYISSEYTGLFTSLLLIFYFQIIFNTHGAFEDRIFNALIGVIFGFFKMEKYVWNLRFL